MRIKRSAAEAMPSGEEWTALARGALGEVASTVEDMLRPHARRELGPAVHRKLVADGIDSLRTLIEHLPAGGAR